MTVQTWLSAFFKSPANQTGLIAGGATLAGLLTQYADHNIGVATLVGSAVFAIAKIVQPDNSALASDLEGLVADAFSAWATKNPAALSKLLADASKVSGDLVIVPSTSAGVTSGVITISGATVTAIPTPTTGASK